NLPRFVKEPFESAQGRITLAIRAALRFEFVSSQLSFNFKRTGNYPQLFSLFKFS
ncbi:MAG: hypothetical protein UU57_C0033G0006, partial [Candidatus Woesebacteria bacterium GW2011_GWE1_41_24]